MARRRGRGGSGRRGPAPRRGGDRSDDPSSSDPDDGSVEELKPAETVSSPRRRPPGVDHLPRAGTRQRGDKLSQDVRQVVRELRDHCGQCAYRRVCAFGPVKFQAERGKRGPRHRHAEILKKGLNTVARLGDDWENALVALLGEREKDALLAACMLAVAWRKRPEKILELIEYAVLRCDVDSLKANALEVSSRDDMGLAPGDGIDPEELQCRMFRGQVLRLASFSGDEQVLKSMQDLLVLDADDEGRLFQYEAVGVLGILIGRKLPGQKWIKSLEKDISGPFRATFAARDPGNKVW